MARGVGQGAIEGEGEIKQKTHPNMARQMANVGMSLE